MSEVRAFDSIPKSCLTEDSELQVVPTSNEVVRPPKVTPEEAAYLLARGPYQARLAASKRIFSIVQGYAEDEDCASMFDEGYLQVLHTEVKEKQKALRQFDSSTKRQLGSIAVVATPASEVGLLESAQSLPAIDLSAQPKAVDREVEGRDSVGLYLEEIARYPLLNAEQEVELSKTIEAGLYAQKLLASGDEVYEDASYDELEWVAEEGERAKRTFVESNLRLAVSVARKYNRSQVPILDLIQEANTGLIRAVEKFDYRRGYKFSTYATWWIRQAITRSISQQSRMVRLPIHVSEDISKMKKVKRELLNELGREPEIEEVATGLEVTAERVMDLITWEKEHVSLDMSIDDSGETRLVDIFADRAAQNPANQVSSTDELAVVHDMIATLDSRKANILRYRYGLVDGSKWSRKKIGELLGVSYERVRQLEREAIKEVREKIDGLHY